MEDKEREKRKDNIIIKGLEKEGRLEVEQVENFFKEKLEVKVKVMNCRRSGKVIVAKFESEKKERSDV